MDDTVAVITRTRNRPLLLPRALDSVLDQSFENWIHVVVNDGGDPATVDGLIAQRAGRYAGRCHVIHNNTSRGMEAASNQGVEASSSRYIVIHDDDDAWRPDFLSKTVAYMEANATFPKLAGVITHTERVVESIREDRIETVQRHDFNSWVKGVHLFRMLAQNMFPPISFLFRRDALVKIGPFREDLPVLGDWEFNVRFLQSFEIGVVCECLAYYHHRLPAGAVEYSNSVVDQSHQHENYSVFLRNEWLRQELNSGRTGIGTLANISWQMFLLEAWLRKRCQDKGFLHRVFRRRKYD
ncbi:MULTISPECIES: glycosyltransferase family 2 protein [unclassified Bradyrhizobium]|uniref:glycosyltransferase family 2 protein n=1 Tax=unclassified Bradyrhizobium TaxID=2631580 RepID=UPI0028E560C7|nr:MULTISPECIES: glycosyltransferase family 2 protein [unclassified Bradyrhizobium]